MQKSAAEISSTIPSTNNPESAGRATDSLTGTLIITITNPTMAQANASLVYSNGTSQPLSQSATLHLTGTASVVAANIISQNVVYAPNSARQTVTVYPLQTVRVALTYAPDPVATQARLDANQAARVNAVINRAYQDNGQTFPGVECKPWASRVVLAATGITVPATTNNGYGWQWLYSPYFDAVSGGISAARRGDFVQMDITNGSPHTFIVVNVYANGTMDVIESNYTRKYQVLIRPNSVKPAPITFSSIRNYYGYAVYRINGKP